VDLSKKIPHPKLLKYVEDRIKRIESYGFTVDLIDKPCIRDGKSSYSGLFIEEGELLRCAIGIPWEKWVPVFIHESCHFDQFVEKCQAWQEIHNCYRGIDAQTIFYRWIDERVNYPDSVVYKALQAVRGSELDCERRVSKEIINNKLTKYIDVKDLNMKANSYIYFHNVMYFTRKWYHKDVKPYRNRKLYELMPDHFDNDYTQLPLDYYRLCLKLCYKKKKKG
jgi:hypothetical protein